MDRDGIAAKVTMNWSPPLCEMLADPLLQQRYRRYCERLLELCEQGSPSKSKQRFCRSCCELSRPFSFCLKQLDRCNGNILQWVRELDQRDVIECITCTATHGFLPLMQSRSAQRAQVAIAQKNFTKHFGRKARGIWLAECG